MGYEATFTYRKKVTTDATGSATVYLTDTGAVGGNALFKEFAHTVLTAYEVTAGQSVNAQIVSISADFKTLVIRTNKIVDITLPAILGTLLGFIVDTVQPVSASVEVVVVGV